MNIKKLILLNLPYLLFVYPFDKLAQAFRLAPGVDLAAKILSIGNGFTMAFSSPRLSLAPSDLLIGIAGAAVLRVAVYLKQERKEIPPRRRVWQRPMGNGGRYRPLHEPGFLPEHPHDLDGADYDGEPSKAAKVRQE